MILYSLNQTKSLWTSVWHPTGLLYNQKTEHLSVPLVMAMRRMRTGLVMISQYKQTNKGKTELRKDNGTLIRTI